MRLTAELIENAPSFFNPLKEREIDLRGNRIALIENLGATEDAFDTIDLSENEIKKLDNFPLLLRLKTLMVSKNKVAVIGDLSKSLPNIESIVLIDNELQMVSAIDLLAELPRLTRLCVLDNPLMNEENARLYMIYRLPQVRVLNMMKVRQKEREAAKKIFGESVHPKKRSRDETVNTTVQNGNSDRPAKRARLSEAEQQKIATAIKNATSMEEVQRLENALKNGQLPDELIAK